MQLPEPQCRNGYTNDQLKAILGDRYTEFNDWMVGQTVRLCDGLRWNEALDVHEPNGCDEPHGFVAYRWDLERFLAGLPIID